VHSVNNILLRKEVIYINILYNNRKTGDLTPIQIPFLHDFNRLISDVHSAIHIMFNMSFTPIVNKHVTSLDSNKEKGCDNRKKKKTNKKTPKKRDIQYYS